MKKLFCLLAIVTIVSVSNCSRIPENNDPIIGIWTKVEIENSLTGKNTVMQEWIFNDVYLGRYHRYSNGVLDVKTDFAWSEAEGIYVIKYPGTDMPDHHVSMASSEEGELLEDQSGNIIAIRE